MFRHINLVSVRAPLFVSRQCGLHPPANHVSGKTSEGFSVPCPKFAWKSVKDDWASLHFHVNLESVYQN